MTWVPAAWLPGAPVSSLAKPGTVSNTTAMSQATAAAPVHVFSSVVSWDFLANGGNRPANAETFARSSICKEDAAVIA